MKKCIFVLLMIILSIPTANAARFKVSEVSEIESIAAISVADLWSLMAPIRTESGEVSVISQLYDPEMRPRRGEWKGCAIVLIGTGDLGVRPVAFRLWSRRDCQVVISKLFIQPNPRPEFAMDIGGSERLQINISNGNIVFIQGIRIGSIDQPK